MFTINTINDVDDVFCNYYDYNNTDKNKNVKVTLATVVKGDRRVHFQ